MKMAAQKKETSMRLSQILILGFAGWITMTLPAIAYGRVSPDVNARMTVMAIMQCQKFLIREGFPRIAPERNTIFARCMTLSLGRNVRPDTFLEALLISPLTQTSPADALTVCEKWMERTYPELGAHATLQMRERYISNASMRMQYCIDKELAPPTLHKQ